VGSRAHGSTYPSIRPSNGIHPVVIQGEFTLSEIRCTAWHDNNTR
jgi:hypothetical protein